MSTRYEKVVIDIESKLAPVMARDAAAAKLLERSLNDLDGTTTRTTRSMSPLGDPNGPIANTGRQSGQASKEIDRFSGRLDLLLDTAALLGPALIPIGAVGIPAVAGLASQFGFAAIGAGTLVASFQGVGDALKAVNTAALEPTAANIDAAREAMAKIGPEARAFVARFQDLRDVLGDIRDAGAEGWFPGLTESMDNLERLAPKVEEIFRQIGEAGGLLAADATASLASDRWADFLDFIAEEAPRALTELGQTVGNLAHGLAELWMAFAPLNTDVTGWLFRASLAFDEWAQGLAKTDGFIEFVDYVRENGPRVGDALAAIGGALLQIVEAAAPLGGPTLTALTKFAEVVAAIADSDLGTPLFIATSAMAAYSRATALTNTTLGAFVKNQLVAQNVIGQTYVKIGGLAKAGAVIAGLTLATSDMGDSFKLSNTAALGMAGTMGGPFGVAAGSAIGLVLDLAHANDDLEAAMLRVDDAFERGTIGEQRAALRDLKRTTDEASRGFLDLGDVTGLLSNPVDAAWSSFLLLSGATGEARDKYDSFKSRLHNGANIGVLLAEPLGVAEDAFISADTAMRQFERSFRRLNNLLSDRQTLIDYERALDDLAKTAKDNEFNPDFEKGRKGLERLNALVDTAVTRSQALREAGDKLGAVRILHRAMDDLTTFGKRSPEAKAAVADLIAELDRLDKKHAEPEIDADNKPAKHKVDEATSWLLDYSKRRPMATIDANGAPAWDVFHQLDAWQPKDKTVIVNVHTIRTSGDGIDFATSSTAAPVLPTQPAREAAELVGSNR